MQNDVKAKSIKQGKLTILKDLDNVSIKINNVTLQTESLFQIYLVEYHL